MNKFYFICYDSSILQQINFKNFSKNDTFLILFFSVKILFGEISSDSLSKLCILVNTSKIKSCLLGLRNILVQSLCNKRDSSDVVFPINNK